MSNKADFLTAFLHTDNTCVWAWTFRGPAEVRIEVLDTDTDHLTISLTAEEARRICREKNPAPIPTIAACPPRRRRPCHVPLPWPSPPNPPHSSPITGCSIQRNARVSAGYSVVGDDEVGDEGRAEARHPWTTDDPPGGEPPTRPSKTR
jgi:hypothetical protein